MTREKKQASPDSFVFHVNHRFLSGDQMCVCHRESQVNDIGEVEINIFYIECQYQVGIKGNFTRVKNAVAE